MRTFAFALAASVFLVSAAASAHFKMTMPPSPTASADGKGPPPCGPDTGEGTVTAVTGGTMIPLAVNENVRHGGFYRVALALKSCKTVGCFPDDNKVYDSANKLLNPTGPGNSDHADIDPSPQFPILADGLFPHTQEADGTGPSYSGMVAIPNVTCDKCTMQVIEFMAPHGPNGSAGYFYHHCADLKITADPNKPLFGSGGTAGTGSGGSAGSGGGGSAGTSGAGGTGGTGSGAAGSSSGGGTATTAGEGNTTAGTSSAAGATSAAGSTSTPPTAGTGTTPTGGTGEAQDDGGCGIAKTTHGGGTTLMALGLLFALGRRRRNR